MIRDIDLKNLQKKVYLSYFQDGWWDMLLGIFLISWGITFLSNLGWIPGIVFVGFYSVSWPVKKWLTYPRIGYARITEAKRQQMKLVILGSVTALLGLMAFLSVAIGTRPAWLDEYFMLLFSAMIAVVIFLLACWWRVNWWYGYAGLLMITACCHQWLGLTLPLAYIIPGAITLAAGIYILFRFLRKYPRMPEGAPNDVSR